MDTVEDSSGTMPHQNMRTRLSLACLALLWLLYAAAGLTGSVWADVLAPIVAGAAGVILAGAARSRERFSFPWFLDALAAFSWAATELWWALDFHLFGVDPEADVPLMFAYLLPNLLLSASVLCIAFYNRKLWSSMQFLLDMVSIFAVLAGLFYFNFFYEHFRALFMLDPLSLSSFTYLVSDLLIIMFASSIYLSLLRRTITSYMRLVYIGLLSFALCDIVYVYAVFNENYTPNTGVDAVYLLSIVFIAAAGELFRADPAALPSVRKRTHSMRGIPYRSLLLLFVLLFSMILRKPTLPEILFFAVILIIHQSGSLIILRFVQKERALEERTRQRDQLEQQVAERTRDLRVMNECLENLVKRDAVTGQYNRKFFIDITEEWIHNAPAGNKIWLLILDIAGFKTINDTYGHDAGDRVLRLIGRKLEGIQDSRTYLARLGGDEFGIVCLRKPEENITELLRAMAASCGEPVDFGDYSIYVGINTGVAVWPDDASNRSDLMRHADAAMYIAKKEKQGGLFFFDTAINAAVVRRSQIDIALKNAKIDSEFSLVYQPQFSVGGRTLVGMEALVRWNSPEIGMVPPDEFIPVAEGNGRIIAISDWIMGKAFAQIGEWNGRYGSNLLMGINISPLQLDDVQFLAKLEKAIAAAGIRPDWLNLEITERCAMKDESLVSSIFVRLAALNIKLSIDDFGTGYSSLSYLKKFDVDYLKIAKQLVDGIETNESDRQIIQAIIMISSALGLHTIAEGMETENQLGILSELGCDEIQGYLFGKPLPPDEFERLHLAMTQSPSSNRA